MRGCGGGCCCGCAGDVASKCKVLLEAEECNRWMYFFIFFGDTERDGVEMCGASLASKHSFRIRRFCMLKVVASRMPALYNLAILRISGRNHTGASTWLDRGGEYILGWIRDAFQETTNIECGSRTVSQSLDIADPNPDHV